jgi:hypothetical protein
MSKKQHEVLSSAPERDFNPTETMQWLTVNKLWLMTWAARNFTRFEDKALFFTVSGHLHKGIVLITLAWDDTYTVRLLSSQWNEKAKFENVYCDELAELIDTKVERIKDYIK